MQVNFIIFILIQENIKDNSFPMITQKSSNYIKNEHFFREMKKKPL